MINVWATWCEPCRRELPYLQSLHEQYSDDGLVMIGTSIDTSGKDRQVANYAREVGMTYEIWRDINDKATFAFRMIGVPETVLLDADGSIIQQWKGPIEPGMGVEETIEAALGIAPAGVIESGSVGISEAEVIGLAVAFSAGLLSFLSPCVLPLVPAYATFITGMSLKELSSGRTNTGGGAQSRLRVRTVALTRGSLFVLGFSVVFVSLGIAVSYVSSLFDAAMWIERIGGIAIIIFGLHLLGVFRIRRLNMEKRFDLSGRSTRNAGSFLVGMGFGAGWTPCIGPILAGILTLAATSSGAGSGALLLTVYSAGLAIPFILSALAINQFLVFFKRIRKWMGWIERASGILLIGIGALLLTGSLSALTAAFNDTLVPGMTVDSG
ncbi:cytochrome c biogenesis protein [Cenarchaeum symbiosum A]|uniref:Cytochrome c biogenesis protein n=1 Tax=Cenarchaeum symbiosum (strain A) TaxID=414004 RepID=A0RTN3_CENSY|nr:cytochrome c biogenesis protein [Cenarchaeum symbiosum A]